MVFEKLCNRAHLVIAQRGVSRRECGLVKNDNLPQLIAGIEVANQPVAENRRICREWERGRSVIRVGARQLIVKQMGVGIKEDDMCVAVIERIVALLINLTFPTSAGIYVGARAESIDCAG